MLGINSRQAQLENYFADAEKYSDDERLKSELAKFATVLVCGYIERSVETVVVERLSRKCHPVALSFIKSHFKKGTNYKIAAIFELLQRFDQGWSSRFTQRVPQESKLSQSVNSLYALRNSISHGGSGNCGLVTVKQYYQDAKLVVEALISSTE
jgi:RiboL-PSP-HEPN